MTNREIAEEIADNLLSQVAWPTYRHAESWRENAEFEITAALNAKLPPPGHIITDDGTVRKVLGTLPVTADGCVAIPLVSVVYHPELPEMTLDVDALDDGNKVVGQCGIPMPDYSCQWREYPISECFGSSAEAARAKP